MLSGGWGGGGGGGGGGFREEDPFAADNARKAEADGMFAGDNTGIDFDAYEDIPVEATGEGVPDPIHSFTGTSLLCGCTERKFVPAYVVAITPDST